MSTILENGRRDFIKKTITGTIVLATIGLLPTALNAETKQLKDVPPETGLDGKAFCNSVMPRALLSMTASRIAIDKATHANTKEFAGFEFMEAEAVIKVLKEVGTPDASFDNDGKAFIEKLKSVSGSEFDKIYMQAELTNHEFLRDLAKNYLDGVKGKTADKETKHLVMLAFYAFKEHVTLSERIYREVTA